MADFETSSEIDIEDLEAHLYGQIYHSTLSEEVDMEPRNNSRDFELNRLNSKKSNRYYENPDINVVPQPYQPNKFIDLRNSNAVDDHQTGGIPQNFFNQNNLYNYQSPPSNDRYSNTCQQFILPGSPGINNIVVIPPAPTQCFSTAFHPLFNKSNRKKRPKQKKKNSLENLIQNPFREHRKQSKILNPIAEQMQPNKTTNNNQKTQSNSEVKGYSNVDIVILSDSNDSDVEEVILQNTVIDISSNDDEHRDKELGAEDCNIKATENKDKVQKEKDDGTVESTQVKEENQKAEKAEKNVTAETDNEDDVILLAEEPVEQEIIEVEDTKDSNCSTDVTVTAEEKSEIAIIQTEGVVDVTNDFLDGVQLGQNFFNFQLHGSDFYCSKSTSQLKSNVNNEVYETESSCSTVDIPDKNNVLNDIGFDAPCKEVFDEPNLETFASFITPKRKLDGVPTLESEPSKPKRKKSKSPKNKPQKNEEDIKNKKKSKVAQDAIESKEAEEKSQKEKKKRKSKGHCNENHGPLDVENEHDSSIIPLELSESGTPKPKKKKKRKNEKNTKKSPEEQTLDSSIDQNDDIDEAPQTSVSSKKRKRKTKQADSDTVKPDTNQAKEHSTVLVKFTNDSDSDISIYTIDYESDNNSNSNLSFCTISETGIARDKQDDDNDDSFDDFSSISDFGVDVEIVNVKMGQENYPLEKPGVHPERKQFSDFWDNDMKKFYSESWGHEDFSVSESQKSMSDDPDIWKILDQDRYLYLKPRGPRCRSCRQWGHLTYRCPNKSNFLVCALCGGKGHMEPRCPNKICTSCGQRMNYFTTYCTRCKGFTNVTCNICNMRGHPTKMCPDLWRRYHLTTEEGPLVSPEGDLAKPFHKRWCSGCGSQGHFEYDCKYYNRTHSATLLAIQSYEPVYEPLKKTPLKRKQESEEGLSKKKQLKTTHHQTDKNKGKIGSEKSKGKKKKNVQEKGQRGEVVKSKERKQREALMKIKRKMKKEQRKLKPAVKSKEQETSKLPDKTKHTEKQEEKEETSPIAMATKAYNALKFQEEIAARTAEAKPLEQEILNKENKQKETNSTAQLKESQQTEMEIQKVDERVGSSEKNDKNEESQSQEENQPENSVECKETSISLEKNWSQENIKEEIKNKQEKTESKENNGQDEVPKSSEENQNETIITTVKHEETNYEESERKEEIKQEDVLPSHDKVLQKDDEITIVEELSTLPVKTQPETSTDFEQQGTSKDQDEVLTNHPEKTSIYNKKLQEFAKNVKEAYKATENSKPLTKKQKKKLAKSQNNPQSQPTKSQQKTPQQQPQSKKKNKTNKIQISSRPGSLFGDPVGSQFLINPWSSYVAPVLNPSIFFPQGAPHLQNQNFYGSPFQPNNYQLPYHANLQDLFSGNSIFSSPAFLHANPFTQSGMGQGHPYMGQGQGLVGMGHGPPNMGQAQVNMAQGLVNMGQGLAKLGQGLGNMGQGRPNLVQESPNVRQEPTSVRQEPPRVRQEPTSVRQELSSVGQEPTSVRQEPPSVRKEPLSERQEPSSTGQELPNNEPQERIGNMSTIDLTEPNRKVKDLPNTGRGQMVEEVDLTQRNKRDKRNTVNLPQPKVNNPPQDEPFTIWVSKNDSNLLNRAHGRFFMRDLCASYGITYHFIEKRKIAIKENVDDNTMDMLKAEINDYLRFIHQSIGNFPLPKTFSDAKEVVKESFNFMGPLERLAYHFADLVRMRRSGNRHPNFVRKMTRKIISINRILIGKLLLKSGKKHLDILRNRFLKGGTEKGEIKEQEWESLNESYIHVFQNDTDELLCIEFLSNLPIDVIPKKVSDDIFKSVAGLQKEDRKSIHYVLNDRDATFCVKNLFHYLDAERLNNKKAMKK